MLEIDADAGTELSLDYAKINYIARAGKQTYVSSDTHGFAGGTITVKSGRAAITGLTFVERLYPFDIAGSFQSNDEALNKLWALCARSCQVFSEDSYVDCADRERTEWMDDDPPAFNITRTAQWRGRSPAAACCTPIPVCLEELLRRTALTVQPDGLGEGPHLLGPLRHPREDGGPRLRLGGRRAALLREHRRPPASSAKSGR